jgi:hypothetical protein
MLGAHNCVICRRCQPNGSAAAIRQNGVDGASFFLKDQGRAPVPMDLAARLCEREFAAIRVQLERDLGDKALQSLDERGSAQELVRQQYSGRYPFELLQNANDAAVEAGRRGRACFTLTGTALIVADNGTGFGEPQVKGICSLGRSPKGPGTSIGHKGLGFKSVGEITDQPQIISEQASFQFDHERYAGRP